MTRVPSAKPAQQQLPFVIVKVNPAIATPENPNGIEVATNMQPIKADMMVIRLLSEGIQQVTDSIQARKPIATNVVMPDGSPAPLPEPVSANSENGAVHEESA